MNDTKSGKRSLTDYQRIPEQSRSEVKMKYELLKEVVLLKDIPEKKVLYHDFVEVQNDFVVFDFHFYRMQYDFFKSGKEFGEGGFFFIVQHCAYY